MKEIWIVEGDTGEYSDHNAWPVKAFASKEKAERLVVEAQARANQIFQVKQTAGGYPSEWYERPRPEKYTNEFDPEMQMEYTGTRYYVYSIKLDES